MPSPLGLAPLLNLATRRRRIFSQRAVSPDLRAAAALALGSFRQKEAREALRALLQDPEPAVPVAASRALRHGP